MYFKEEFLLTMKIPKDLGSILIDYNYLTKSLLASHSLNYAALTFPFFETGDSLLVIHLYWLLFL